MSKDQIQKYVLMVLVAGAALYGYIFVLYIPELDSISKLGTKYEQMKSDLEDAKQRAKEFDKLQKEARKAQLDLFFAMRRLPGLVNQTEYLKEISRAAADHNISIQTFTPGQPVAGKSFYNEVPLTISMVGNYNDFGKFITKLGYSIRMMGCNDVQFASTGLASNNIVSRGSVNLSVNLRTYVSTQVVTNIGSFSKDEDTEERAISPLYRYVGAVRDPFVSLSMSDSRAVADNINISALKLTAVMVLNNSAIFIFQDPLNNGYKLRGGKFYTKDEQLIKGIEGKVSENKVKLAYTDKSLEVGPKEHSFEIPK